MNQQHLMVIGAQKAGTTRLQHLFDTNEHYFCPVQSQEIHFFDRKYDQGEDYYLSLYENAPAGDITIDVTPAYLTTPEVPERIKAFQDRHGVKVKLVVIFREPVSRIISAYQMRVRRGYGKSLQEAVVDFEDLVIKSSYLKPLQRYIELFGRENILVLINEEMRTDFKKQCLAIQEFLGTDKVLVDKYGDRKVNMGGDRAMPVVDRWFRWVGNFMRGVRLHQYLHYVKRSPLIQTIYKLNHKPVVLSEQDTAFTESLREQFRPQVLALDELLEHKDLLNIWGYEQA